jgi:hypothetical protein
LTGTIFAGHHQPLRVWILGLYFLALNLSNEPIGHEFNLDPDDAPKMATQLREGIVERKPVATLSGEVECDEVYVVAGHKGHPEAVKKGAAPPTTAIEGGTRAGDIGQGKAPHLRQDSADRDGGDPDAGERQTSHDRSIDPIHDSRGNCCLHE